MNYSAKIRIATNMLIYMLIAFDKDKKSTKEDFKKFIQEIINILNNKVINATPQILYYQVLSSVLS